MAVAEFIIGEGFGQLHASTVRRIDPTSPGKILSVPSNMLFIPLPSNNGLTKNSSEVSVVVNPPVQAPYPAVARSSTAWTLSKITFPKFSILNSYTTSTQPSGSISIDTSRFAIPISGDAVKFEVVGPGVSPGSGSLPLVLSSVIGIPSGPLPVPVALFITVVGLAHPQASTVKSMAPVSPTCNTSVPVKRLIAGAAPTPV